VEDVQIGQVGFDKAEFPFALESSETITILVVAVNRDGKDFGYASIEYIPGDTTAPAVPTGLEVPTGSRPHRNALMHWTLSVDPIVATYQIWRREGDFPLDPTGAILISTINTDHYTDTTGTQGAVYTWFIKAVSYKGIVSDFSIGASGTVPCNTMDMLNPGSYFHWVPEGSLLRLIYHED